MKNVKYCVARKNPKKMRYVNATSWEYCRADAATLMTKAIGVLPQPMTAHWGIADPAPVIGPKKWNEPFEMRSLRWDGESICS